MAAAPDQTVAVIDIARQQGAGQVAERIQRRRVTRRMAVTAGGHWRIIGAGDGDRHCCSRSASLAIIDRVAEHVVARRVLALGQRLNSRRAVVQRVDEGTVGADVHAAVNAGNVLSNIRVVQRRCMLVTCHYALNRHRVVIDIAVLARANVGHHVAADRADTAGRYTFKHRCHVVGSGWRMVHEDLDVGAGKQLSTVALILSAARRTTATDIRVLVVQRIDQGHAGVVRRCVGIAVGDCLHGTVYQRGRGVGVESQRQRACTIDIAANVRGPHHHIAAAQRERAGGCKHVIDRSAALARETQRRAAPVVALDPKFAVCQSDIGINHDRRPARRIRCRRRGVDGKGVKIADGRCVVDRCHRQLHGVSGAGIAAAAASR